MKSNQPATIALIGALSCVPLSALANPPLEGFALIDEGFRVFTEETFDGNGRTCGTCHVPSESYNIFPETIKVLEALADYGDAAAQEDLDEIFAPHVPGLENEELVRQHALFNISGGSPTCTADTTECFDDDVEGGPIFRTTMTIQGIDLTTENVPTVPNFPALEL